MRKVFLAAVLAVLVGAVFLTGCAKGEAAEITPELKAQLDAEFATKLEKLTPEEQELVLGNEKALTGLAYFARASIMLSGSGYSCKKCCCEGQCCEWVK